MSLCGNDFLPNIPFMDISSNFIYYLLNIMGEILSETHDFIVKGDTINFASLKLAFQKISQIEEMYYLNNATCYVNNLLSFAEWKYCPLKNEDEIARYDALTRSKTRLLTDFSKYKEYYYKIKLGIDINSS